MFHEDAELAARVLEITLTSRGDGVPLAGVPVKAAADYLRQLVARRAPRRHLRAGGGPEARQGPGAARGGRDGHAGRAAAGGVARRRPGTTGWSRSRGRRRGARGLGGDRSQHRRVRARDARRGGPGGGARAGSARPRSSCPRRQRRSSLEDGVLRDHPAQRWEFDPDLAREELARRFALASLDGLGIGPDDAPAVGAAGALLRYLGELQPGGLPHLARPVDPPERRLPLARRDDPPEPRAGRAAPRRRARLHPARGDRRDRDADGRPAAPRSGCSRRSAIRPRSSTGSTRSRWRCATAAAAPGCARRSTACATSSGWRAAPRPAAPRPASSARCATRSFACPTSPRRSARSPARRSPTRPSAAVWPRPWTSSISSPTSPPSSGAALEDRPPADARPMAASSAAGYDRELDELRSLRDGGRQYIASLQQRERERTGIASLKVGFNKVFGYYLEITNAHAARVPADYERRQTLAAAERYVTPGAQGVRGARCSAPRSGWPRARRSCSARSARRSAPGDRAGAANRPGAGAARRLDGARRSGP